MSNKSIAIDRTETDYERSVKVARYRSGRLRHVKRWCYAWMRGEYNPVTNGVRMLLRVFNKQRGYGEMEEVDLQAFIRWVEMA